MKSGSRGIGCYNDHVALKFDRHFGSVAAEVPVKFLSDSKVYTRISRLRDFTRPCGKDIRPLSEKRASRGGSRDMTNSWRTLIHSERFATGIQMVAMLLCRMTKHYITVFKTFITALKKAALTLSFWLVQSKKKEIDPTRLFENKSWNWSWFYLWKCPCFVSSLLATSWTSNYMPSNVWDEITYPFLNFNGATVEV